MRTTVTDRWVMRRLPRLVRAAGLELLSFRSRGLLEAPQPTYMLTVVDRGADTLCEPGRSERRLQPPSRRSRAGGSRRTPGSRT